MKIESIENINTIVILQEQKDDKHKPRSYNDVVDKSDEKYADNVAGELFVRVDRKSKASTQIPKNLFHNKHQYFFLTLIDNISVCRICWQIGYMQTTTANGHWKSIIGLVLGDYGRQQETTPAHTKDEK